MKIKISKKFSLTIEIVSVGFKNKAHTDLKKKKIKKSRFLHIHFYVFFITFRVFSVQEFKHLWVSFHDIKRSMTLKTLFN